MYRVYTSAPRPLTQSSGTSPVRGRLLLRKVLPLVENGKVGEQFDDKETLTSKQREGGENFRQEKGYSDVREKDETDR